MGDAAIILYKDMLVVIIAFTLQVSRLPFVYRDLAYLFLLALLSDIGNYPISNP